MGEVHLLPGVDSLTVFEGQPRSDISELLRGLADRADLGEIESVALVAITRDRAVLDLVCTTELHHFEILGAIEGALKPSIMDRYGDNLRSVTECDPDPPNISE